MLHLCGPSNIDNYITNIDICIRKYLLNGTFRVWKLMPHLSGRKCVIFSRHSFMWVIGLEGSSWACMHVLPLSPPSESGSSDPFPMKFFLDQPVHCCTHAAHFLPCFLCSIALVTHLHTLRVNSLWGCKPREGRGFAWFVHCSSLWWLGWGAHHILGAQSALGERSTKLIEKTLCISKRKKKVC